MDALLEFLKKEETLAFVLQLLPVLTPYILDVLKKFKEAVPALEFSGKLKLLSKPIKWGLAAFIGWLIAKVTAISGGDVSELTGLITGIATTVGYGAARDKPPKTG